MFIFEETSKIWLTTQIVYLIFRSICTIIRAESPKNYTIIVILAVAKSFIIRVEIIVIMLFKCQIQRNEHFFQSNFDVFSIFFLKIISIRRLTTLSKWKPFNTIHVKIK